MGRIGMALDVSHLSDRGIEDALRLSTRPVFASHSNARAVFPSPRSLTDAQIRAATLVAWDGCCPIHAGYTPQDVAAARAAHPNAELLIHPEAPSIVAARAEHVGSTKAIIEVVSGADPGAELIVGTEERLVRRLAVANPHLRIHSLRPILCADMGRTTPEALLRTLTDWPEANRVRVDDALVDDARASVERMLAL